MIRPTKALTEHILEALHHDNEAALNRLTPEQRQDIDALLLAIHIQSVSIGSPAIQEDK